MNRAGLDQCGQRVVTDQLLEGIIVGRFGRQYDGRVNSYNDLRIFAELILQIENRDQAQPEEELQLAPGDLLGSTGHSKLTLFRADSRKPAIRSTSESNGHHGSRGLHVTRISSALACRTLRGSHHGKKNAQTGRDSHPPPSMVVLPAPGSSGGALG